MVSGLAPDGAPRNDTGCVALPFVHDSSICRFAPSELARDDN